MPYPFYLETKTTKILKAVFPISFPGSFVFPPQREWAKKRFARQFSPFFLFCRLESSASLTIDSLVLLSFWRNTCAFLRAELFQVQWHVELAQVKLQGLQSLTNPGRSIVRKTRKKNYGGFARNETPFNSTENINITRLFSKGILRHAKNLLAFVCSWH